MLFYVSTHRDIPKYRRKRLRKSATEIDSEIMQIEIEEKLALKQQRRRRLNRFLMRAHYHLSQRHRDDAHQIIINSDAAERNLATQHALAGKLLSVAVCVHELNYYDRVISQFYTHFNAVNYFLELHAFMQMCDRPRGSKEAFTSC
jgi:hypothetical protein